MSPNKKIRRKKITIIAICFFILQPLSIIVTPSGTDIQKNSFINPDFVKTIHQKNNELKLGYADLELVIFEVWWSNIDNGTLYVRYLVNNIGESYHNSDVPIKLNITLQNSTYEYPFAFINQSSFIDPYTWYTNETIGGCIQIALSKKPNEIIAIINSFLTIPETNIENNIGNTSVYHGIIIKGQVNKRINQEIIPASHVYITRCNDTTLQSSLCISFKTNQSGHYIASLYPKQPFDTIHSYHVLFSDKESKETIIKDISSVSYNTTIIQNITYHGSPPQQPRKPIGFPIGIIKKEKILFSSIRDLDRDEIWYKFKWDPTSYSPWIESVSSSHIAIMKLSYNTPGIYPIQIIVKDVNGMLSAWSEKKFIFIFDII